MPVRETILTMKVLFEANMAALIMRFASIISTVKLQQDIAILPVTQACTRCNACLKSMKVNGNYNYFECISCKKKILVLNNTLLLKLS